MPGTPAFTLTDAEYERVGSLFLRHRLPAIGPPASGFLLRIEIAEDLMLRRLAYLVARIAGGTESRRICRSRSSLRSV